MAKATYVLLLTYTVMWDGRDGVPTTVPLTVTGNLEYAKTFARKSLENLGYGVEVDAYKLPPSHDFLTPKLGKKGSVSHGAKHIFRCAFYGFETVNDKRVGTHLQIEETH